jgi:hypothetical protein
LPTSEPLAGLAQAFTYVDEAMGYLESHELVGTDELFRVYLACYRVLRANEDPRAEQLLNRAYDLLQGRAAKIADEGLRRSFLEDVAANREVLREWQSARR